MRRRQFIILVGGAAAAAWPLAARAQQSTTPVVGFLSSGADRAFAPMVAGFIRGLNEAGFTEGQNVAVEYRWAEGEYDRLPAMANELVRRPVNVLVASGGTVAARAAKAATSTIPIVFSTADDPVDNGLVASLNRPGGNITGVAFLSTELGGKRLGLAREMVPQVKSVALLVNAGNPESRTIIKESQEAASSVGITIVPLDARTEGDINAAFRTAAQKRVGALIVGPDPLYFIHRELLITLAAHEALPTIYFLRDFVTSGGLMSYGTSFPDSYRQLGIYVGRIMKGAKPGDLPVIQPTKFELAINLKTAKALRLTVPPGVLAIADEVIE